MDSSLKSYAYSYDALNRITAATDNTGNYNVGNIGYDKMGNIRTLTRNGLQDSATFTDMDILSYAYDSGNKLLKVADTGNKAYGFRDGTVDNQDYWYDTNGNMVRDLNKGIGTVSMDGISYNHLNLPINIAINNSENTGNIEYIYDATGTRLRKIATDTGESSVTTTDYAGNYIYENNVLQFFNHPEGYVRPDTGGGYDYIYQYRDHLGNIRLSYTDDPTDPGRPTIIEENNYYPYGLRHRGYNMGGDSSLGNDLAQKWKFGGKELDDSFDGTLNTYDFGARNYDPALGRWMNLDPLAEQMRRHSPYNYAFNNPIYFLDPDGMSPFSTHTDEDGNVLAVYDDGDLGVYAHENGTKKADIDSAHSNKNKSAGGTKKGETLHTFSFVNGDELEKGKIVEAGKIDFGSTWAQEKVQKVLEDSNGIVDYGLNAGTGEEFDIKLDAIKDGKGDVYYGSQIKDGVYASARDAGNFAAGAKADNSIFSNSDIMYGYGAFNAGGNNAKSALFSIVSDLIIRISGGDKGLLQAPSYGEDKQSYLGINAGMKNSKWFDK